MQGINIARNLTEALKQRYATVGVFFFDGPMPTTIGNLAFNPKNIQEIMANAVGYKSHITVDDIFSSSNSSVLPLSQPSTTDFPAIGTTSFAIPTKHVYSNVIPTSVVGSETTIWPNFNSWEFNSCIKDLLDNYAWWRVGRGGVSAYLSIPEIVNSVGDPLNITGYAFRQRSTYWRNGAATGYIRATSVSLEMRDDAAGTFETGTVVGSNTDLVINEAAVVADPSTVGGRNCRIRVRSGADYPYTQNDGRTGDPHWSIIGLTLLTDQEPFISPTDPEFRQITWALVVPVISGVSTASPTYESLRNYLGTNDVALPITICDVGLVGSGAGVELEKTDTSLYVSPEIVKFNLEFRD